MAGYGTSLVANSSSDILELIQKFPLGFSPPLQASMKLADIVAPSMHADVYSRVVPSFIAVGFSIFFFSPTHQTIRLIPSLLALKKK